MDPASLLTVLVLVGVLGLLVSDRVAPSVAVMGGVIVLLVGGVLTPDQAFQGFSNPAPFTVAALYIVARAVEKTGGLQPFLRRALTGVTSPRRALARLLIPVAAASAFLNNTPIVATVAPQVESWARRTGQAPSRFLLPLSYAAILGGTVTAIGTSTTLVVSGLLQAHGLPPLALFEVAPLGLPLVAVGLVYMIVLGPRLLPVRARTRQSLEDVREFMVCMEVVPGGVLDGRTVEEGGLRELAGVFLAEVRRPTETVAPAAPTTRLAAGDLLIFVGLSSEVLDLRNNPGLRSAEDEHARPFHDAGHTYFEGVVGPASPLVGRTLKEADFRRTYQSAVLAIHRAGEPIRAKLGQVPLRAGDTLLMVSDEGFRERWRDRNDFLLIAHLGGQAPTSTRQAWLVWGVLAGIVALSALSVLPILHLALLGALVLVGTRVLTPGEARRAVDLDVILLIAGALGLGAALEVTGLASTLAANALATGGAVGPAGLVASLVVLTLILTELVTNNAAAILVFPVALQVADGAGMTARGVALLVAVSASASFITPVGYQTNTMVLGPGGYRVTDYLRFGWPLSVATAVVLVLLARWPLALF